VAEAEIWPRLLNHIEAKVPRLIPSASPKTPPN
jgi:hypothetical protein